MGIDKSQIFHLAIPCKDLDETERFYVQGMGATKHRRYDDRVTFEFFGEQLVCHLSPGDIDEEPSMYPRHFGITFLDEDRFDSVIARAEEQGLPFFKRPFIRFGGMEEEHRTFFLVDPANNLLEFKFYKNAEMAY